MNGVRRADANLVLTGFMGTGKTVVGQAVAQRLGREFVDMDELIVRRVGKPIPAIFAEDGETVFRRREAELCQELSQRSGLVIATGGGALIPEENRRRMRESGLVICLNASPEEILRRLEQADDRPLLNGADRRGKIEHLLERRREAYAAIPVQLDTTGLAPEEVVERVLALWEQWLSEAEEVILPVRAPGGGYEIRLGRGALRRLGEHIRSLGVKGVLAVVSNPTVWELYEAGVEEALRETGLEFFVALIPDGEAYKTLGTVSDLYERFLKGGLDRSGMVAAVGGGVVGDVAGFAAATYMRGVRLVQVPTTLLVMVDSSVGGKTGVDLPQGKNLVGAFHQPSRVVIDPDVLRTLPVVELRCGLAETIKAAIIGDPVLLERLEQTAAGESGPPPYEAWDWPWIVRRALAVKIAVVEEDPLEQGRRAVLNLGHTVGHALERVSGYTLRHGEAVSVGMVAEAWLAVLLGRCDPTLPERLTVLLNRLGLPTRLADYDPEAIWEAMQTDKKRQARHLRFALPHCPGDVFVTDQLRREDVLQALEFLKRA